jgi:DNA-binding NarL/FixJ family response regulator
VRTGGRVLIADDHPLTREGLALAARSALAGVSVTTAGSIGEAVEVLDRTPADRMILLDLMLPDARGYSGLMMIQHKAPRVPIVIVSARESPKLVEAARAVGAAGFLFKSLPLDEIAGKLREVEEGRQVFPANIGAGTGSAAIRDRIAELSPAQRSVLFALADGRSNKAIAHDLDVTEATIKAHLTAIFRKLGVTNRAQALIAVQPLFGAGEDEPAL